MKGFPSRVDGPLGPWHKKVNQAWLAFAWAMRARR